MNWLVLIWGHQVHGADERAADTKRGHLENGQTSFPTLCTTIAKIFYFYTLASHHFELHAAESSTVWIHLHQLLWNLTIFIILIELLLYCILFCIWIRRIQLLITQQWNFFFIFTLFSLNISSCIISRRKIQETIMYTTAYCKWSTFCLFSHIEYIIHSILFIKL